MKKIRLLFSKAVFAVLLFSMPVQITAGPGGDLKCNARNDPNPQGGGNTQLDWKCDINGCSCVCGNTGSTAGEVLPYN